jgi:transcriptional regulator with XRE-family HTH domain
MAYSFDPATLLRMARTRMGLSQRVLAARAGTSQSVVARVEGGLTDPSSDTLTRLLGAAGVELRCLLDPLLAPDSHMLEDVPRILAMTPEDRLLEVRNFSRFLLEAQRAREDRRV